MKISVVIPVYKSTASLKRLSERIDQVFRELEEWDYEIIFVNDSPRHKQTRDILRTIAASNLKVSVVELMKNFGQQPATLCGIEHAKGDFILTMDDDLQHAPEDIPLLLEQSHHDAVIALFLSKKHSLADRLTSKIKGYFDTIILGKPRQIELSPFRLIKDPIAKLMLKRNTPFPFIPALLLEITDDVVNVALEHHARTNGRSNYTFLKRLVVFSNLIINNSSMLLRFVGFSGVLIAISAFISAIIIIFRKIMYGVEITGWPSTIVTILFFGGMILLTLGVVGEYLLRLMAISECKPKYFVRHHFTGEDV